MSIIRSRLTRFSLGLGILVAGAGAALSDPGDINIGTASSQDMLAVLFKTASGYFDDKRQAELFTTIYCVPIVQAKNEFERRDFATHTLDEIRTKAQAATGVIRNIQIVYDLGDYDFARQGFPLRWGRYDFDNDRRLFSFVGWSRPPCWQVTGALSQMPSEVRFLPTREQIRQFFSVPEADARLWVQNGRPRYRMTFDLATKSVFLLPTLNAHFAFAGEMLNVKAEIIDSSGSPLSAIDAGPQPESKPQAAAPKAASPPSGSPEDSKRAEAAPADGCMDCDDAEPSDRPATNDRPTSGRANDVADFIERTLFRPGLSSADELRPIYGQQVSYFGKQLSSADVLADKARYFKSWPQRAFRLDRSSLSATESNGVVAVTFRFSYKVSGARGVRSGAGTARYRLKASDAGRYVILAEDSSTDK